MDRRDLFDLFTSPFKESKKLQKKVIRPPYFIDENSFHNECIHCEDKFCFVSCQESIIIITKDKTPCIDFNIGGCTYCDECAINCPKDVLKVEYKRQINIDVEIDMLKCLSWNGVMCFSCKDPCIDEAIEFLGIFKPNIIKDKCTSCGFCINSCPSNAIILKEI